MRWPTFLGSLERNNINNFTLFLPSSEDGTVLLSYKLCSIVVKNYCKLLSTETRGCDSFDLLYTLYLCQDWATPEIILKETSARTKNLYHIVDKPFSLAFLKFTRKVYNETQINEIFCCLILRKTHQLFEVHKKVSLLLKYRTTYLKINSA